MAPKELQPKRASPMTDLLAPLHSTHCQQAPCLLSFFSPGTFFCSRQKSKGYHKVDFHPGFCERKGTIESYVRYSQWGWKGRRVETSRLRKEVKSLGSLRNNSLKNVHTFILGFPLGCALKCLTRNSKQRLLILWSAYRLNIPKGSKLRHVMLKHGMPVWGVRAGVGCNAVMFGDILVLRLAVLLAGSGQWPGVLCSTRLTHRTAPYHKALSSHCQQCQVCKALWHTTHFAT